MLQNWSEFDLWCVFCSDVKNTYNGKGTRFQTHHQTRRGEGVSIFIEKKKEILTHTTACDFQNSTIFLGGKFRWHWIQDTHAKGQMQSYCDHLSNCRKKPAIYFHGNVTEFYSLSQKCMQSMRFSVLVCEAVQKLFSLIDYTNTSRNNKKCSDINCTHFHSLNQNCKTNSVLKACHEMLLASLTVI